MSEKVQAENIAELKTARGQRDDQGRLISQTYQVEKDSTGKIIKENARAKANRKYENTKTKLTVRLDAEFRDRVNAYAESKGLSVNQLICQLLEREIDNE